MAQPVLRDSGHRILFLHCVFCLVLFPSVQTAVEATKINEHGFSTFRHKTLHFPPAENERNSNFLTVSVSQEFQLSGSKIEKIFYADLPGLARKKRSTGSDDVDPLHLTTKADLDDAHSTIVVHWVGSGRDEIFALAKDVNGLSSALFISKDYGKHFTDVSDQLMVNASVKGVIDSYYDVNAFNYMYMFADVKHDCVFTSVDTGSTFETFCHLPFKPRTIKLYPSNPNYVLAMDDEDPLGRLYSSIDFGRSWELAFSHVKSFHWSESSHDQELTVYMEKEVGGHLKEIVRCSRTDEGWLASEVLLSNVVDFEMRDEYLFATKSVRLLGLKSNPNLQLWVSHNRGSFMKAQFPVSFNITDFYVADTSEGQVMVCVSHNSSYTNLYISEVNGYRFSLSLEKIVFFNPRSENPLGLIRFYTNKTFADIKKLSGVEGVYLASQQIGDELDVDTQRTLVTFDKGGRWQPIPPPEEVLSKNRNRCSARNAHGIRTGQLNNCSLHLTQEFHRLYPTSQTSTILSKDSAPGLVIASGMLGTSLNADADVFVSSDAGFKWRMVLSGNYFYNFGDHGGVIIAAHQFIPTNEIIYSIDEGATWQQYRFLHEQIRVYGILTEPGEKTTTFSIFGSQTSHHSWIILQIDFRDIFKNKSCSPNDYKMWSASYDLMKEGCLMGHLTEYQRKIANAACYNGQGFVREVQKKNCSCTREDFECDYGFKESVFGLTCSLDPSVPASQIHQIPTSCHPGSFYESTRGYRKVSGDTCQGGEAHKFAPLLYSCPVRETPEFFLMTREESISVVDIASLSVRDLVHGPDIGNLSVFSLTDNCLFYVSRRNRVKKICFSHNSTVDSEDSLHGDLGEGVLTGMDYDWTARVLYLTSAAGNEVRVLHSVNSFTKTIYDSSNGVFQPRRILVDPHHGYLFFVGAMSAGSSDFGIFRAVMDGSDSKVQLLANSSVVSQATTMAFDLSVEKLYWVTPEKRSIFSMDMNGDKNEVSKVYSNWFLNSASGIAVYKQRDFYISCSDTTSLRRVKETWRGWEDVVPDVNFVASMRLVSNTSQHAVSACNEFHMRCSQLCLPRPTPNPSASTHHQNRTCACGDGYRKSLQPSAAPGGKGPQDETCLCGNGETMIEDGTCVTAENITTCATDHLRCRNGHCVLALWKCDGDDDCGDFSDEIDCPLRSCGSDSFTCRTGRCIPFSWKCDREDDCRDGSATDEQNCENQTCSSEQMRCNNGYCVSKRFRCDKDDDCLDGTDEENCSYNTTCYSWEFQCANLQCVDSWFHCNGHPDCDDGSDETDCDPPSNCTNTQFACETGDQCIFNSFHCDGNSDCQDGSDEKDCEMTPTETTSPQTCQFRCRNSFCIAYHDVCNGFDDCGDNSDEVYCSDVVYPTQDVISPTTPTMPSPEVSCDNNHFLCREGPGFVRHCIHRSWLCDGDRDCYSGEDEAHCQTHNVTTAPGDVYCQNSGRVISMGQFCDQNVDCSDGSDELGCEYTGHVDCSHFNDHKDICCSTKQCQVYSQRHGSIFLSSGRCRSKNSYHRGDRNSCEGVTPHEPETSQVCGAQQFECRGYWTCISFVQVCDLKMDCPDRMDERQNCGCKIHNSFQKPVTGLVTNSSISWVFPPYVTSIAYSMVESEVPLANLTWVQVNVSNTHLDVVDLVPYTAYRFVFFEDKCALYNLYERTEEGVPAAPENLKVRVHNEYNLLGVDVLWQRPSVSRGEILRYNVYYQEMAPDGTSVGDVQEKLVPASAMRTNHRDFKTVVVDGIHNGRKYDFWVAAVNHKGIGKSSSKVNITVSDKIPLSDLKVKVAKLTDSFVNLTWVKDNKATGFKVTVHMEERGSRVVSLEKTVTWHKVDKLCPGSSVQLEVQAVYPKGVVGRPNYPRTSQGGGWLVMQGVAPVVHIESVNMTGSTSAIVHYHQQAGTIPQHYNIYYSTRAVGRESLVEPHVFKTSASHSFELHGLLACESYFVAVQPDLGSCPLSDFKRLVTQEDESAAPKHLKGQLKKFERSYSVTLTWSAPCSHVPVPVRYLLQIKMGSSSANNFVTPKATNESHLSYVVKQVVSGETYRFTVRTYVAGSQESHPLTMTIPELGAISDVQFAVTGVDSLSIFWIWPQKDTQNFKEYIVSTVDQSRIFSWANHTSESHIDLSDLPVDRVFNIHVKAMSKEDTVLAESHTKEFSFLSQPGASRQDDDSVSIKKTNLVAILVPVGVVVVLLSAGLVVFIVRHKRLQRSFLAFANSHYNIQSGTTTFSDDLDGDEPLIQGFSDDEPLVIG
ncbi:sortilin-related receptor [Aplysia californica]|uniref:Sortilin-related receptor n=1 Tax=Aplysia californica TaxID=6500 RepID=A0ABM0ZVS7_APLCA|nr:sortilin-related receptor [Aplysia californica]